MANEAYDVFISYSRADSRHATEIDSVLRSNGLRPFFDRRNLAPGLPWVRALEEAISAAKAGYPELANGSLGHRLRLRSTCPSLVIETEALDHAGNIGPHPWQAFDDPIDQALPVPPQPAQQQQ